MEKEKRRFARKDRLLLFLVILPLVFGMVLKVLFTPKSDEIAITGALIYFDLTLPFDTVLPITEAQVNSWLVILSLFMLCVYMTHGISAEGKSKRQMVSEWIVEKTDALINENMGEFFQGFSPFIAAVMALSAFSSLMSLLGLYPPTSDLNVVGGWAILVFILITHYKLKCGPVSYIKSFAEPVAFLAPLNVISEFATPVSMAFRHYGNVLSGAVISVLVGSALESLSKAVLHALPGAMGNFPLFKIGLPAVLSVYFDIFSGLLQAFIFAMLTMLYIAGGFPEDLYRKKHAKT